MPCRFLIRSVAGVCAIAALRTAATAQWPAKPENLQVLPKDMPTDSVVAIMRGFTMALGVRCQFCHVERPAATNAPPGPGGGGPFQNFDFKLDDKKEKKTARVMLRMVDSINTAYLTKIPERDDPHTNVGCVTCHRGLNKPRTIEAVLLNATARFGVDSAIGRYRSLRNDMTS